jgi:AcrR family transcriptional regulator
MLYHIQINYILPVNRFYDTMKNRATTERKIINAVGKVIRKYGYKGLGINKIAQTADVNKNLIYRYFGDVDSLVEKYIREKDYWLGDNQDIQNGIDVDADSNDISDFIIKILQNQLRYFFKEEEMQHIIFSEISENNELLKKISLLREEMADPFFERIDKYLEHTDINFRGVAALLVSGIYYLVLQSKKNDAINCGINLRTEEGQQIILQTLKQMVEMIFRK